MEIKKIITIAKFMGWSHDQEDSYRMNLGGILKYSLISNLRYDLDWKLLMAVVEKIESIKIEDYSVRVDICFNCCRIAPSHWQELISIYGDEKTKLEATFIACFEFIEWFNKQKN